MKTRSTIKILGALGASAALLPATSFAAVPGFTGMTATNGTISGCPAGFTCTELVAGDGFRQSTITDGTDTYIQTVVTDLGAGGTGGATVESLPFSDVSYIKNDGSGSGMLGKQTVNDPATNFTGATDIASGWAGPGGTGSVITFSQSFSDDNGTVGMTTDDFTNSFTLTQTGDGAGNVLGQSMVIDQNVGMGTQASDTDKQRFMIVAKKGDQLNDGNGTTTTGSLTLPAGSTVPADTVTWNDADAAGGGDDVMIAWLGQQVDIGAAPGNNSLFGFESVTNRTGGGSSTTTFSLTATDVTASPFQWDAATFGVAPTL
ncbi:MAG: hypothetical protein ACE5EH_00405 [Gammaproteobacteria bacterium]